RLPRRSSRTPDRPRKESASPIPRGRDLGRRRSRRCRARGRTAARAWPRGARRAWVPARVTCRRGRRCRTSLEARQVLAELPVGDLLVVTEPLVPLDLRVVVGVVLAASAAERLAEHVVPLELVDCLEQVCRQRPEA